LNKGGKRKRKSYPDKVIQMLPVIGDYTFPVEAYSNDFRGKSTLQAVGGFLMQAATRHAEERGFGYSFMLQNNRTWVLSRLVIEMSDYPVNDTRMLVSTWVPEVNKLFTERCFSLSDSTGKNIGYARSLWAAIDLETRRPTNILDLQGFKGFIHGAPCPIENVHKIPPIKEQCLVESFMVKYSDLDVNKHLNSMKYVEHFADTFSLEMYQQKDIRRFEICFMAEGQYGTKLDIFRKAEENDTFVLEMRNPERAICSARIAWDSL
jgi:acyl-ACP thioesterase